MSDYTDSEGRKLKLNDEVEVVTKKELNLTGRIVDTPPIQTLP